MIETHGRERCPEHQALLDQLLTASAARHRHLCPRQVLGIRMGLFGLRQLGLQSEDGRPFDNEKKHLLTIMETDGCGADGVAVATDCHVGRRTLRVVDYGKMAATFVDTRTETAVRVAPAIQARQTAVAFAPEARSRWHAYLAAYQVMPDDLLLQWQLVRLSPSAAEIISRPGVRVACQACGEEIINEREVMCDGRVLCRYCAGDPYYLPLQDNISATIFTPDRSWLEVAREEKVKAGQTR